MEKKQVGESEPCGGCDDLGGCEGLQKRNLVRWECEQQASEKYPLLAGALAKTGLLFKEATTSPQLLYAPDPTSGEHFAIRDGTNFDAAVKDLVDVTVFKDGKTKGVDIPTRDLKAMLQSQHFLAIIPNVDFVSDVPCLNSDFTLCSPGFTNGSAGNRILFLGETPEPKERSERIVQFLEVMDFAENVDRTNTVGAALTVLLRNHFPGAKPCLVVTANKSHGGKGTIIDFATGLTRATAISYQSTDWAMERAFVGATAPESIGLVHIDNVRLLGTQQYIASAFLERFITDPEPLLFSTGTGAPRRRPNHTVVAISSNLGQVSEDLMNRSLPIHLECKGDVASREHTIGNPKLEFLPRYADEIQAELLGMVCKWVAAGSPMDEEVQHPFTGWGQAIGGILKVNGFE
ncbi:MAG: hypothetical protein ACYTGH_15760, partial [Planctomycetota bacterium]